jgi:predicted nucleic acid-binding protein
MTFFFLDGSALAKCYVAEPGTPLLDHLLDHVAADRLIVLNIGFAEVVSVLVRRKNAAILSAATFSQAILHLGKEIIHATNLRKVEPTNNLVIAALSHIQNHSVNSTDAIVMHAALGLAQHLRSRGDDLVLVASDQRLLRAAQSEGLVTFNPETQDQAALAALVGP